MASSMIAATVVGAGSGVLHRPEEVAAAERDVVALDTWSSRGRALSSKKSLRTARRKGQLRCKRCRNFFKDSLHHKEECRFHPGRFQVHQISQSTSQGWSCCATRAPPLLSSVSAMDGELPDEQDEYTPGCRVAPSHLEDKEFTKALALFDAESSSVKKMGEGGGSSASSSDSESESESSYDSGSFDGSYEEIDAAEVVEAAAEEKADDSETPGFFRYAPQKHDTLSGLALRYGVSAAEIQRANRTTSREVFQFKLLLIPRKAGANIPPPVPQAHVESASLSKKTAMLAKLFPGRVDRLECQFYLKEAEGDMKKARAALEADLAATPELPHKPGMGLSQLHI